ncbi:MAG: DUF167 domain-containing protein [Oxalobacteraceae bacterium]|nr:DUF167 domain-containing protein [Oxalobacteraceae bacterium]
MSHAWCHRHPGILRMAVHVQPGARVSTVIGEIGGALKIRLHAPPVDGKANAALIAFVAGKLGIRQRDVRIVRGQTNRQKLLDIDTTLSVEEAGALLL